MALIARTLSPRYRAHTVDPNDERLWPEYFAAQRSMSGVTVSDTTAMRIAAAFACALVIAEDVATLPLHVYQRTGERSKRRAPEHPLYRTLRLQPNPWMTAFDFRALLTTRAVWLGNGYAEIKATSRGPMTRLDPIHPRRVIVESAGDRMVYRVREDDGRERVLLQDEMFHVRGRTLDDDAVAGVSVITYARETFGLALATESHGARVFSQGASLGGVLKHPKTLSDNAAKRIRSEFHENHAGLANANRWTVLEEGMEAQPLGMSNEDAQFLASREHQVIEICRWFRMQPHKIAHLVHATFSNIEHQALEHVTDTIMPWTTRWEQAVATQLLLDDEAYYVEHLFDNLLRGDTVSRFQSYGTAVGGPVMTANEAREKENLDPIEGGDTLIRPLNMAPAGAEAFDTTALYSARNRNGHHVAAES